MKDVLAETTKKMSGSINHLKEELRALRTGRANPGMVDKVMVVAYGTSMRLVDIATISVPEARTLLISPFDATNVHAIAKGIEAANLNLRAVVDSGVVRITVPEMNNSLRQEMIKQAKKMGEESKIAIRNARREANDFIKGEKDPEDVVKSKEKKIQELTDKSCKQVDELCAEKEKEIANI